MYQRPFQKIQPQTTAHLAQTMTLLYMNIGELNQEINRALNENPALVISEELRCPICSQVLHPGQKCPSCIAKAGKSSEDAIVFASHRDDFFSKESLPDDDYYHDELYGHQEIGLGEYILTQIAADLHEEDRIIVAYILNQLDEDGFFMESLHEVANYYHIPLQRVENVIHIIQHAEPLGSGSSSPDEAIKVQLSVFKEMGSVPALYLEIAENHLQNLLKKNFKMISRELNVSIDEIERAAGFFSKNLNPYPARAHWGTFRLPGKQEHLTYTYPDVIINHLDDDLSRPLIVEVVIPGNSTLEVNPYYTEALKDAGDDVKADLKNDVSKAQLFIKCMQQRNNTLQKLLRQLVSMQKDFINKGEKHLKPITRVQLSKMLKVHESTVSRAVSNKSVQLPDGRIIPMASFFDRSLSIRTQIKELIQDEKKNKPLSDAALVDMLNEKGYEIARRTVAKYRAIEGILPAYQRKINK